jgi:iron complex transport system substrate-binding protein
VKERLRSALSVYNVDTELLERLQPDVIVTQAQCEVCAVSLADVEHAVCGLVSSQPRIVSLEPNRLADVWADIGRVAEALDANEQGGEVVQQLQARIDAIGERAHVATPNGCMYRMARSAHGGRQLGAGTGGVGRWT